MKIKEAINYSESKLNKEGIKGYKSDVEIIFSHLFNLSRTDLILNGNKELSEEDLNKLNVVLEKRINRIPVQEIFGFTEFFGLNIKVSKDVLTPRPETELVLNEAINILNGKEKQKVLDLCTGSGILGLAIKSVYPSFDVTMSDISLKALEIAHENSKINNLDVNIIKSDMFSKISDKYDLIISNPPYIPLTDKEELEKEVLNYDPAIALFGGVDGLDFYRTIANEIENFLNPNGALVLEIGYNQGESVKEILSNSKIFSSIEIKKDYSDFDRIVICKR